MSVILAFPLSAFCLNYFTRSCFLIFIFPIKFFWIQTKSILLFKILLTFLIDSSNAYIGCLTIRILDFKHEYLNIGDPVLSSGTKSLEWKGWREQSLINILYIQDIFQVEFCKWLFKTESQLAATYFQLHQLLFIECPLSQRPVISIFHRLSWDDLPVTLDPLI